MTPRQGKASVGRWLVIAATVVVLATVSTAILVTGTPSERRAAKLDERRIADLQRLAQAIDAVAQSEGTLPADLAAVTQKPGRRLAGADPVTALAYEYVPKDDETYRLCAVFVTDTATTPTRADVEWDHGSGRHCFERRTPRLDREPGSE